MMIQCRALGATEDPVPHAATVHPSPNNRGMHPFLFPAPCPLPPASQHCSLGAGGVAGGEEETTPKVGWWL